MSDVNKVRIGIAAARELEIDVDDPASVVAAYEKALKKNEPVLWITDLRDHQFGIAVESVAFIEIEKPQERGIGFGAS